ncbi:sigma-70 family RNA polymerase sigma factor [Actinokineospora sp. HUAS TT18]|uniref:sigma-70 family RNA polymerase sigma factor n=1 Tax=Actinokineospora sp. HUAS TT18 TaxID=3447451 RepID=UPI003F51E62C
MTRPTRPTRAPAVPHARPAGDRAGSRRAETPDSALTEAEPMAEPDPTPEPAADLEAAHAAAWDLVHAAQGGDTHAFGQLYDRYVDMVFRYVLFRVGDRELAEDVTSETFLRALRRITSVSYQGRDVGAWFVTIARNLVLDHVKSSRFRLEVTTSEIRDSERVEAGPEQQVMSKVTRDALLTCVDQLGDDQRECIVLRFLQGMSVAETAVIMNRNEGAVKALQHRAVRRLAQLLPSEIR